MKNFFHGIFFTMPDDTSLDGFDHAIHYLIELKNLDSNDINDDSFSRS